MAKGPYIPVGNIYHENIPYLPVGNIFYNS